MDFRHSPLATRSGRVSFSGSAGFPNRLPVRRAGRRYPAQQAQLPSPAETRALGSCPGRFLKPLIPRGLIAFRGSRIEQIDSAPAGPPKVLREVPFDRPGSKGTGPFTMRSPVIL